MLPVHGAHRLLRGRAGRHGQLLAGRLREPLHRGEHQHERRGRLPRAGQDLPRGDDSLRHGAGQPQHHHGRGQQPRVQLRAHDHRRVRLHADERRGLVRRPGQPAGHADDRPAAKDRGQGGRLDRGLPFPLRQGHGNRARTAASCASPFPRANSRASRSTWRAASAARPSGNTSRWWTSTPSPGG